MYLLLKNVRQSTVTTDLQGLNHREVKHSRRRATGL